jgi:hypothetical protein
MLARSSHPLSNCKCWAVLCDQCVPSYEVKWERAVAPATTRPSRFISNEAYNPPLYNNRLGVWLTLFLITFVVALLLSQLEIVEADASP